jgi:hypothetical protein
MKITKITYQHRRDFDADTKCEFCGHLQRLEEGYDDEYFHQNVMPNIKCRKCEKSTISGNGTIDKVQTKYPEGYQI